MSADDKKTGPTRGRPSKSEEDRKSSNLRFRTRSDLRELIEKAAAASGRSASEEIEHRLYNSFRDVEIFKMIAGGSRNANVIMMISNMLKTTLSSDGTPWYDDPLTARVLSEAASNIIWSNASANATRAHRLDADEGAKDYISRQAVDIANANAISRLSEANVSWKKAQWSPSVSALEKAPDYSPEGNSHTNAETE